MPDSGQVGKESGSALIPCQGIVKKCANNDKNHFWAGRMVNKCQSDRNREINMSDNTTIHTDIFARCHMNGVFTVTSETENSSGAISSQLYANLLCNGALRVHKA